MLRTDWLVKLKYLLSAEDKVAIIVLLFFSLVLSLIEVVGVSLVMPFIAVSTNKSLIDTNKYFNFFYTKLNIESFSSFIIIFGLFLIVFYLIRALVSIGYFYALSKFSLGAQSRISNQMFKWFIDIDYSCYISLNSNLLKKAIISEAGTVSVMVQSMIFIFCEALVLIFIYFMMFWINRDVTIVITVFLLIGGAAVLLLMSKGIRKDGIQRELIQRRYYEILGSTFGNLKLVKLNPNRELLVKKFQELSDEYAAVNVKSSVAIQIPRLTLEMMAFGMLILIIVVYTFYNPDGLSGLIPTLSVFGLGLLRVLPSFNRIITSYNNIIFNLPSVAVAYDSLNYPRENLGNEEMNFNEKIELNNVSFSYDKSRPIFSEAQLIIKKGERVAVIGESGAGKSTFIDILTGLLNPEKGQVEVDGKKLNKSNSKSFRNKIGYIPQSIYLFDSTVAENVSFESSMDRERVRQVLKQANILEWLEEKSDGIETKTGEGGIALSGGQKQRIAIARALYNNPEILILDEATSALDTETERKIMNEIYTLSSDKTLIIITHRISTIDQCDRVVKVENGKIIEVVK